MSTDISVNILIDMLLIVSIINSMMNSENNSLTTEVYNNLLDMILSNKLIPGDILSRKDIAKSLNVSMAPVRDALIQLSIEGFVKAYPRKGTVIKSVTSEDVFGALVLREAIETQAARLYFNTNLKNQLGMLREKAQELDEYPIFDPRNIKLELNFHLELVKLSDCDTLIDEYKRQININIFYRMNNFLTSTDRDKDDYKRTDHIQLLDDLLDATSPEEADILIRKHLNRGKTYFINSRGKI